MKSLKHKWPLLIIQFLLKLMQVRILCDFFFMVFQAVSLFNGEDIGAIDHPMLVNHANTSVCEEYIFFDNIGSSQQYLSFTKSFPLASIEPLSNHDDLSDVSLSHPLEDSMTSFQVSFLPLIRVTVHGIPPNTNLFSFTFLSTFGVVFDGKVITNLGLYYPDGDPLSNTFSTRFVFFTIAPYSVISAKNLLSFNSLTGRCSEYSFHVSSLFSKFPLNYLLSCSSMWSNLILFLSCLQCSGLIG